MYCENCGKKLEHSDKFCDSCGKQMENGALSKKPAKTEVVISNVVAIPEKSIAVEQPAVINTSEKNNKQKVNKFLLPLAILVALSLILTFGIYQYHQHEKEVKKAELANQQRTLTANFESLKAANLKAVVNILCDDGGGGSGTIFSKDGLVLTNNHVIEKADSCAVTLPDPITGAPIYIYKASPLIVPSLSEQYDIALLNIDSSYTDSDGETWGDYPTIFPEYIRPDVCDDSIPQLGDSIKIYGYPETSGGYNLTVTEGIVSSFADDGTILTSAKIDSGNSGGFAVDQNGCFVGIPSAVIEGKYQNLGVIISGSIIKDFLNEIPSTENSDKSSSDMQIIPPIKHTVINCLSNQCILNGQCFNKPANSYCTNDDINAWKCNSGYIESKNSCILNNLDANGCTSNQCFFNFICVNKPLNSTCSELWPGWSCNSGYIKNEGVCILSDLDSHQCGDSKCQQSYGAGSVYSYYDSSKNSCTCDCASGSVWNSARDTCVTKASIDQICKNKYGIYSYYLGYVQDGKYMCQ